MRRLTRLVVPLACTLLAGCAVLSILALPFKLLFKVVEGIAGGLGSLTSSSAFIDVHEGEPPRLVPLGDGTFAVDDVRPGAQFDIVLSAPDHTPHRYRWPEDLAGLVPSAGGVVEVPCSLRRAPAAE